MKKLVILLLPLAMLFGSVRNLQAQSSGFTIKGVVVDVNDVPGVQMLIDGTVTITNIICGFDNDADMFKHFDFAYNRENVELLPPIVKLDLNHHMY